MSQSESVGRDLAELIATLESAGKNLAGPARRDGIDDVLASPERVTEVRSLRDAPPVEAFRQALVDGFVRVDTVNALLKLLNEVIGRLIR